MVSKGVEELFVKIKSQNESLLVVLMSHIVKIGHSIRRGHGREVVRVIVVHVDIHSGNDST
jgi:hypothetical protein